jgi:hypothetical protein
MIDFKKSILNLHTKFPEKDLDELLEILDCIVDTPECFFPSTEIGVRRMPYVTEPKSVPAQQEFIYNKTNIIE